MPSMKALWPLMGFSRNFGDLALSLRALVHCTPHLNPEACYGPCYHHVGSQIDHCPRNLSQRVMNPRNFSTTSATSISPLLRETFHLRFMKSLTFPVRRDFIDSLIPAKSDSDGSLKCSGYPSLFSYLRTLYSILNALETRGWVSAALLVLELTVCSLAIQHLEVAEDE